MKTDLYDFGRAVVLAFLTLVGLTMLATVALSAQPATSKPCADGVCPLGTKAITAASPADLTTLLAQFEAQAKAVAAAQADLTDKAGKRSQAQLDEIAAETVDHQAKQAIGVTMAAISAILDGAPPPAAPTIPPEPKPAPPPPPVTVTKPTLLIITMAGCPACSQLKAYVDSVPKLAELYVVTVDASPATAAKYGVTACPTTIVLDAAGKQLGEPHVGFSGPKAWMEWLNSHW